MNVTHADISEDSFALGCQSARAEARSLLPLLGAASTVEAIGELIAVPARTERLLRAFARAHPEEAHSIHRILNFRSCVLLEFERLVREGIAVAELQEVNEPESDAAEETYAVAQR